MDAHIWLTHFDMDGKTHFEHLAEAFIQSGRGQSWHKSGMYAPYVHMTHNQNHERVNGRRTKFEECVEVESTPEMKYFL